MREKIIFFEGDKNDISDNEDIIEDIKLFCLLKYKEELVKEGMEDEGSLMIMICFFDIVLINSKINIFLLVYILDKNYGYIESNECISNEKDECYVILKIMDDVKKYLCDIFLCF